MHAHLKGPGTSYAVETIASCPVCGSEHVSEWVTGQDQLLRRSEAEFTYARCQSCSAYFQKRRPTEGTISFFYQGDYGPYAHGTKHRPPIWPLQRLLLKVADRIAGGRAAARNVNEVFARLTPASVLLDFGCGSGLALDARRRRYGCRTIGMDFNRELLTAIAERGHEAYLADADGWNHIGSATVDLVTMNHVLEHLYRPLEALTQIRRVLKPSGVLHIAVPNPEGYSAQTFGADWFGLDCPRHIVLYGPQAASGLLRRAGFESVAVIANPVTKDAVRSKARKQREIPNWPLEYDGWRALKVSAIVRREASLGRFDQFHLIAKVAR